MATYQKKLEVNPDAPVQQAQALVENKPPIQHAATGGQELHAKLSPLQNAASQTLTCASCPRWIGRCLRGKIGVIASSPVCQNNPINKKTGEAHA